MDVAGLSTAMLAGAAVVLLSVLGVRLSHRVGLPGLLLYLGVGLGIGAAFPQVRLADPQTATVLGYAALAVILAEGGLSTRVADLRPVLWPAVSLATIGVATSILVVAGALVLVMGVDARSALLLGSVLAATDAAAVFSVLRGMRLHPRLRSLLEAEAGANDAPVVVLVVILSSGALESESIWQVPLLVAGELVGGAAVGLAVSWAARWGLPRVALPAVGLYPIAVLSILAGAYGLAGVIHSSGFMAVYVAGVLIGSDDRLPHRRTVLGFAEALAWVAQIGLFVMLGLLTDTSGLLAAAPLAAATGAALILAARPLAAVVSLTPFRVPTRWVMFVGAAGLRGAVPIVFAAIPLGLGVPGSPLVFDATVILVVVLTLVQTPVLPRVARRLGLELPGQAEELQVEAAPMDQVHATLLGVDVPATSALAGLYLSDLQLPTGAAVSLIVRAGQGFVPDAHTRFRPQDHVLIVVSSSAREATVTRLRRVSREGRLAGWRPAPDVRRSNRAR